MKHYKSVSIILLFLCLTFETLAQYNFLRRGNPSPYDSGVVVEISEYRKIRKKVLTADSLVAQLNFEVIRHQDQALNYQETIILRDTIIARQDKTIVRKDKVITDLSQSFDDLAKVTKKAIIFKNPWLDGLAKIGIGVFLSWGINKTFD